MNQKPRVLIVFGLDADKKPHAAKFDASDEPAVTKAAGLTGFQAALAASEEAQSLASKLPDGKIFGTGKALVPYVKEDVYDKLVGLISAAQPTAPKDSSSTTATPNTPANAQKNGSPANDPWAEIKVGSVVLCQSPEPEVDEDGYWASVVVSIAKDGEILTVRWKDYPKLPRFTVRRQMVGLLRAGTTSPS